MSDQNRDERLQIMLTEDELRALDDWRFERRMPSRAAAVRELLRRGLAAEGLVLGDERNRSKDFGVTDAASGDSSRSPGISSGKGLGNGLGNGHGNGRGNGHSNGSGEGASD